MGNTDHATIIYVQYIYICACLCCAHMYEYITCMWVYTYVQVWWVIPTFSIVFQCQNRSLNLFEGYLFIIFMFFHGYTCYIGYTAILLYPIFWHAYMWESHITNSTGLSYVFPKFSGYLMSMNPISKHTHKVPKHGMRI